jgi:DNA-binding NarL/FixJ family response regulator
MEGKVRIMLVTTEISKAGPEDMESRRIEIIGEAESGRGGQKSQEPQPDIIIMDISMPVLNGLEATVVREPSRMSRLLP